MKSGRNIRTTSSRKENIKRARRRERLTEDAREGEREREATEVKGEGEKKR